MNIIARTLTLILTLTSGLQAQPNFMLRNSTPVPIHFVVTGANDLFALRDGEIKAPLIITLNPGEQHEATLGLTGVLHKPAQIDLFPNPQGQQFTLPVHIDILGQEQVLHMPVGANRIYKFETTSLIAVELVHDGTDVAMRPVDGIAQNILEEQVERALPFEQLNAWASDPANHKAYSTFQAMVYPFTHAYVKAWSPTWFVTRHFIWATKMGVAYVAFGEQSGIQLVPIQSIAPLLRKLRII